MASNRDFIARKLSTVRDAADSNMAVERAKRAVYEQPHDADLSKRNAAKARAEGWNQTSGPTHTPDE
jgi:hypothetical protein